MTTYTCAECPFGQPAKFTEETISDRCMITHLFVQQRAYGGLMGSQTRPGEEGMDHERLTRLGETFIEDAQTRGCQYPDQVTKFIKEEIASLETSGRIDAPES